MESEFFFQFFIEFFLLDELKLLSDEIDKQDSLFSKKEEEVADKSISK